MCNGSIWVGENKQKTVDLIFHTGKEHNYDFRDVFDFFGLYVLFIGSRQKD